MSQKLDEVSMNLMEFEKSPHLKSLNSAIRVMVSTGLPRPSTEQEAVKVRQQQLKTWLKIQGAIERNLDPNLGPPPIWNSCIPQYNTNDPRARVEFERKLKEDRAEAEHQVLQHDLRLRETDVNRCVERFLLKAYTSSAADQKEIMAILAESGISEARKQKLKALFGKGEKK